MPDVLAIHWERKRLRVIEASVGGSLRVAQGFVIDVPEVAGPGWLREALRRHGVTAKQALVSVPREDAILRQLELPDAPDDELPLLVSFQASTRSTTPLDQLVLDYVPLPRRAGSPQKDVLLASVPRTVVNPIRTTLTEAGIELTSLTIGSFALAELVAQGEAALRQPTDQRSLLVQHDAQRLEIVLLGQRGLLSSHQVRPPLDEAGYPVVAKAAAEVSRVLVPAQPWLNDGRVDRIWLLGDANQWPGLDKALGDRWNCPVERFDPHVASRLSGLDSSRLPDPAQFAHAIGLALSHCDRQTPAFDLLHPHQPKPQSDPRKLQLAAGSAAALLVITLCAAIVQMTKSSLDRSIADLERKGSDLSLILKAGQPTLDAAKTVGDWTARDVNQLKLIAELNEHLQVTDPPTDRPYVSDYKFGVVSGDALAKLNAKGNAKDRINWQLVSQNLVDAKTFRVRPTELTQTNRDPDYPNHFELDADLIPPPKTAPAGKPTAGNPTAEPTATKGK